MRISRLIWLLFVLNSVVNLIGELTNNPILTFFSKPLLMPLLAVWFLLRFNGKTIQRFRNLIFIGLLLSTAGDVLLLFVETNDLFFLAGLVSFLLAHLCYIAAFLSYPKVRNGNVARQPLLILPFLIFLIAYNLLLFPKISVDLRVPVIIYSAVIIGMAISALNLRRLISTAAFQSIFGGTLLFVISDSLLAFHKFYDPTAIPLAGFFIMLTYILGQYFIIKGAIQTAHLSI